MNAAQTRQMFVALKQHFTNEGYDFFKYKGTVNRLGPLGRHEGPSRALSKKYTTRQMPDALVANVIAGVEWIGDVNSTEGHERYLEFLRKKESITRVVSDELDFLVSMVETPRELFFVGKGQLPIVVQQYLSSQASLETVAILNDFVRFSDKCDVVLGKDDFIWSKVRLPIIRLGAFLSYDKSKISQVLSSRLHI